MNAPLFDIVIPTIGRDSLDRVLAGLRRELAGAAVGRVVVVDDRRDSSVSLAPAVAASGVLPVRVERTGGAGPAFARNAGIRATTAPWVVFVDDDVVVPDGWVTALTADLQNAAPEVGGVQGRIVVPLPARPTDWQRNVAGLADARWATADMAYRRAALIATGGFDTRFGRAYREDADLALRVMARGYELRVGSRFVEHPVRPAPWWISIAKQAGNADDVVMRRLHGRDWRARAQAPAGRLHRHQATVAAAAFAIAAFACRRPRLGALGIAAWAASTAEFTVRRVAPGPRDRREVATMAVTSAVIPFAATAAWVRGHVRARVLLAEARPPDLRPRIDAVVVDRDGTIVVDVPYNGDPAAVVPMPGAIAALDRLRRTGLPIVVATNQSGVARGYFGADDVERVNARVAELLGPFAAVFVCCHGEDDACTCRKPAPGLVFAAARAVGADPERCVMIGDCAADIGAAEAAGATAILVPNERTRREEVAEAPLVAPDLRVAADYVLAMVAS